MRTEHHVSATWIHLILDSLNKIDMDTGVLVNQSGIDSYKLNTPDAIFTEDDLTRLWQGAAQLSGNPAIGLTMGKNPNLGMTNPIALNLMSSKNVGEAQQRFINLQHTSGLATYASMEQHEDGNKIMFHRHGGELSPIYQGFDASLALFMFSTRFCSNVDIIPKYVSFQHPEPSDISPYQELFRCPLKFDQPEYGVFINKKDLDIPLIFSNNIVTTLQEQQITLENKENFSEQVRDFLKQKISGGEPAVKTVAEHFNLGPRTLQRRLKQDGWTYTSLLDNTRKRLADLLITKSSVSLKQVTYELGFSDHSNFYRAFKRWYNCTPGEYRKSYNANPLTSLVQ